MENRHKILQQVFAYGIKTKGSLELTKQAQAEFLVHLQYLVAKVRFTYAGEDKW